MAASLARSSFLIRQLPHKASGVPTMVRSPVDAAVNCASMPHAPTVARVVCAPADLWPGDPPPPTLAELGETLFPPAFLLRTPLFAPRLLASAGGAECKRLRNIAIRFVNVPSGKA